MVALTGTASGLTALVPAIMSAILRLAAAALLAEIRIVSIRYRGFVHNLTIRNPLMNWRVGQDSNLQPSDPKSEALSN
jgi:hypothetical protein